MIASLLPVASKLLGKFIEDKDTKNKLAHEIATMAEKHAQQLAMEQIKVNIEEAKGNWFQSSIIYDATENADAVVILTEWEEFKNLNWQKITNNMRSPSWIFDTRYLLNPEDISKLDINYWRIGYGDQMIDVNKDL